MIPAGPLRRIVGSVWLPKVTNGIFHMALYEALECGHWQLKHSWMLGPKERSRRCVACAMLAKKGTVKK